MELSRQEVLAIKEKFPKGTRIKLISMIDPRPIESGTLGTVMMVDDLGTLHTKWDNGRMLGLVYGEDEFQVI